MFDGFSAAALKVVSVADSEARSLEHGRLGTEHLLLGLLSDEAGSSAELLRAAGATLPAARHMVAEVVGTTSSPSGAELSYTARAQRALERAARFSRQERSPLVDVEHVLLGVLDVEGLACQVLRRLGADVGQLRDALAGTRGEAESREADSSPAAAAAVEPRCPSCGRALGPTLGERVMDTRREDGVQSQAAVVFCTACGSALGVLRP